MTNHWLEISRSALQQNISLFRSRISPQTKLMVMVKANAYGHGLTEVSQITSPLVDFFGVNTFAEALVIRNLNITTPILVAAPVIPQHLQQISKSNISVCVPSLDYLHQIKNFSAPLLIHLKINTGTNRLGLSPSEVSAALKIIQSNSDFLLEGIYTHFHSSDSGSPATLSQFQLFQTAVAETKKYFPQVLAHCASTSAILDYPKTHLDMVRLGIGLYGLWPDPFVADQNPLAALNPVLSWKCQALQVRPISAGETVSYGATFTYTHPGLMAVLPVGYSDGFDRGLGNIGQVYFMGRFCPVIGRVAMNLTMIDITNCDTDIGEALRRKPPAGGPHELAEWESRTDFPQGETQNIKSQSSIELLGPHITADSIAQKLGTINYEIVSRLSPFIPRQITP